jgi:hypothetical protein
MGFAPQGRCDLDHRARTRGDAIGGGQKNRNAFEGQGPMQTLSSNKLSLR